MLVVIGGVLVHLTLGTLYTFGQSVLFTLKGAVRGVVLTVLDHILCRVSVFKMV